MPRLFDDRTPVEKLRARGESIVRMRDGSTKRLKVYAGRRYAYPHIRTGGQEVRVQRLDPPEETTGGLPIEWTEVES